MSEQANQNKPRTKRIPEKPPVQGLQELEEIIASKADEDVVHLQKVKTSRVRDYEMRQLLAGWQADYGTFLAGRLDKALMLFGQAYNEALADSAHRLENETWQAARALARDVIQKIRAKFGPESDAEYHAVDMLMQKEQGKKRIAYRSLPRKEDHADRWEHQLDWAAALGVGQVAGLELKKEGETTKENAGENEPVKARTGGRPKSENKRVSGLAHKVNAKGWEGIRMTLDCDTANVAIAGPSGKKDVSLLALVGPSKVIGVLFSRLAGEKGKFDILNYYEGDKGENLAKRHQGRLNDALREAFGLNENPIALNDGIMRAAFRIQLYKLEARACDADSDEFEINRMFSDCRYEK